MSAPDTAWRVLHWACGDRMRAPMPPPPTGDLAGAVELADPPAEVRQGVVRLAAVSAARLRLPAPPLRDSRPPALGAALLAGAIGARERPADAIAVLTALRPAVTGYDLVAYHGLAGPALAGAGGFDPDLAGKVRDLSPLTGLLDHPGPTAEPAAERTLAVLLADPDGRALAVSALAEPPAVAVQARWRGELLARYRYEDQEFVLDVYERALSLHGDEHRRRVREAWQAVLRQVADRTAVGPVALWWRGLAEIERSHQAAIRARPGLTGYLEAVRLHRWYARRGAVT